MCVSVGYVCIPSTFSSSSENYDDSEMDGLEPYWLETHTHTRTHTYLIADSHSKSLENGLKCNWETQQFNTPAHHEQGNKQSSIHLINMFFLQNDTYRLLQGNNFKAIRCYTSMFVFIYFFTKSSSQLIMSEQVMLQTWFSWVWVSVFIFRFARGLKRLNGTHSSLHLFYLQKNTQDVTLLLYFIPLLLSSVH